MLFCTFWVTSVALCICLKGKTAALSNSITLLKLEARFAYSEEK